MPTTVQVSDEVREQMEELKEKWGLKSYDEVIKRMIRTQTGTRDSMFGVDRGLKPFKREAEDEHDIIRD